MTLTLFEDTIFTTQIDKNTFEKELNSEFYDSSILKKVNYDIIKRNRIYLKALLGAPETDWLIESSFAVFYKAEKKGQFDSWTISNVGL